MCESLTVSYRHKLYQNFLLSTPETRKTQWKTTICSVFSLRKTHPEKCLSLFCISETDIMITLHSFGGGTAPDLLAARKAPLTAHSSWACFTSVRRARHSFTHRHLSNIAKWKKNSSTAEPVQTWFISYRHRLQSRKKNEEWMKKNEKRIGNLKIVGRAGM